MQSERAPLTEPLDDVVDPLDDDVDPLDDAPLEDAPLEELAEAGPSA